MKNVLIAVNGSKSSKAISSVFHNFVQTPEEVTLLHVEKLQGKSLMTDMLGDAEMSTLKESMKDTEHKEALDKKAAKILDYYSKELGNGSGIPVKTLVREGHPVEEIIKAAEECNAELIIVGGNGKRGLNRLITGCVDKDVEKRAKVPVLIAKSRGSRKSGRNANASE